MKKNIAKSLLVLGLATALAGCKLAVMVVEGGDVESPLGTPFCLEGNNCLIEIRDTTYTQDFTAVEKPGYVFTKWNTGGGFFCADSTSPTCTVSVPGGAIGDITIASFEYRGYIMPVFKYSGIDTDNDGEDNFFDEDDDNDEILDVDDPCPLDATLSCGTGTPITNTIIVAGKEWAQVSLFNNVSREQINTACPGGTCKYKNVLIGWDMTGWKFASLDEVNTLFNFYIGSPKLGPGPSEYLGSPTTFAKAFFDSGWIANCSICGVPIQLVGLIAENYVGTMYWSNLSYPDAAMTTVGTAPYLGGRPTIPGEAEPNQGAFFYRTNDVLQSGN